LAFRFLARNYRKPLQFTRDMKKMFVLSMLIAFAMICACQKQNSAAEQQLAQRKTELDTREAALYEREKALVERERALAQREKPIAKIRTTPPAVQGQTPDASQAQAERDRRIQQLPPELQALVSDRSQVNAKAEKDRMTRETRERLGQRQLGPEDLQRQWQRNLDKAKMSGKAVFPAAEATSPTPSPAVEATSPSPSPTPE
jgi:hypothetical protein